MIEIIESDTDQQVNVSLFADYDIFLFDERKIIHIATAGMNLINSLEGFNSEIDNLSSILKYRRVFKILTNDNLKRENIESEKLYQSSFIQMATKGFFSYDKVDIDNPYDYKFQLISRPSYQNKKVVIKDSRYNNIEVGDLTAKRIYAYDLIFIKAKRNFPEDFTTFDISNYI
jgi:hypothetical protein